ncbi:hypothetical protein BDZ91DRAFT_711608 [Kalaharituber pfeilii]|nr:hypothetical protein BDZ91DRAFT_711608 [Kalaharituber pfeilii]
MEYPLALLLSISILFVALFRSCSYWPPQTSVSTSTINLQHLLEKLVLNQYDTYGVEEL